jgi:ferredoxin
LTYVISDPCIGTKDNSCVDVCPVDCIHPTSAEPGFDLQDMLHINPAECIDCDACVLACPVGAIFPESQLPVEWTSYKERNAAFYQKPVTHARNKR